MKSVRLSVFETNSSSSHSISVKRNRKGVYDYNFPHNKSGKVPLIFGLNYDFGWGPAVYRESYAKLNYLACIAFETHFESLYKHKRPFVSSYEDVLKIKDIKKLETALKGHIKDFRGFYIPKEEDIFYVYESKYSPEFNGSLKLYDSVDHQMWEGVKDLDDFLKRFKITLENFLFNPTVVLIIDNDN